MPYIILFFISLFISPLQAEIMEREKVLEYMKAIEAEKGFKDKTVILDLLQNALNYDLTRTHHEAELKKYQEEIKQYPYQAKKLKQEIDTIIRRSIDVTLSSTEYEYLILQTESELLELSRQQQKEQDKLKDIIDSLGKTPKELLELKNELSESERRLSSITDENDLNIAKTIQLNFIISSIKALINTYEYKQISAISRQDISRLRLDLIKQKYDVFILIKKNYNKI